jgi:hypothetical protein
MKSLGRGGGSGLDTFPAIGLESPPPGSALRRGTWCIADSRLASIHVAKIAILLLVIVLSIYTYPRWGNVQIDRARDLYVADQINKGRFLYRDIWYPYGPIAPYLNAVALYRFGLRLNVFYALGIVSSAVGALLGFSIARRFLGILGGLLAATFFVLEGFGPGVFNFVLPCSYAAIYGLVLTLACRLCVLLQIERAHRSYFIGASICAGLALGTKPEFGISCFFALLGLVFVRAIRHRSLSTLAYETAVSSCGVAIAGVLYGFFIWRTSLKFIIFENF